MNGIALHLENCVVLPNKKSELMLMRRARAYSSYLTPACAGLLEPRGSRLKLPKSTFSAEDFICSLYWSLFSHFQLCRGYGYPWIYPWIYLCVDIRL